jgi:hypothetical protein
LLRCLQSRIRIVGMMPAIGCFTGPVPLAQTRKAKPMSKRIVLNSFRAMSFDVLVRQAPSRGMHSHSPRPEYRRALLSDGGLPIVGRWLVDFARTYRAETTGHFPDRSHPLVNGRERVRCVTSASSGQ